MDTGIRIIIDPGEAQRGKEAIDKALEDIAISAGTMATNVGKAGSEADRAFAGMARSASSHSAQAAQEVDANFTAMSGSIARSVSSFDELAASLGTTTSYFSTAMTEAANSSAVLESATDAAVSSTRNDFLDMSAAAGQLSFNFQRSLGEMENAMEGAASSVQQMELDFSDPLKGISQAANSAAASVSGAANEIKDSVNKIGQSSESSSNQATKEFNDLAKASGTIADAFDRVLLRRLLITTFSIATFRSVVKNINEAANANRQLALAVETSGRETELSTERFKDFSREIQSNTVFTDENVQSTISQLIAYRSLSQDGIERVIKLSADLSARFGGDLTTNALRLARALEAPAEGLGLLRRAGVMFTEEEEKMIKVLVEAGDSATAQAIILQELEMRAPGAARAMRDELGGALKGLVNDFSDAFEGGEKTRDAVDGLTDKINKMAEGFRSDAFKQGTDTFLAFLAKSAEYGVGFVNIMNMYTDQAMKVAFPEQPFDELEIQLRRMQEAEERVREAQAEVGRGSSAYIGSEGWKATGLPVAQENIHAAAVILLERAQKELAAARRAYLAELNASNAAFKARQDALFQESRFGTFTPTRAEYEEKRGILSDAESKVLLARIQEMGEEINNLDFSETNLHDVQAEIDEIINKDFAMMQEKMEEVFAEPTKIKEFYQEMERTTRSSLEVQGHELEAFKTQIDLLLEEGEISHEQARARLDEFYAGMEEGTETSLERQQRLWKEHSEYIMFLLDQQIISQEEANERMLRSVGPFADYIDSAMSDVEHQGVDTWKKIGDGIADLSARGKADFKSLAQSIIQDIIRVQVRAAIAGLFAEFFTTALGGIRGDSSPLTSADPYGNYTGGQIGHAATGARVSKGDAYVTGEMGRELFIADKPGRILTNKETEELLAPREQRGDNINLDARTSITLNIEGGDDNNDMRLLQLVESTLERHRRSIVAEVGRKNRRGKL